MPSYPLILNSIGDPGQELYRLDIQSGSEMDEAWLQNLIYQHPELLPVAHFDSGYAPLVSLGREVPTARGPIDNLYVSPEGVLTVVETKLWKNADKHRTVVAQILDYAKELAGWSYDDLAAAVDSPGRKGGGSTLEERVKPALVEASIDLLSFQESLVKNLASGNMLLLIVGDRVSANVALMAGAVQGVPGFDFTIGLIEMQIFASHGDQPWPIFIVSDVVGRTVEKTRGVVRVVYEQSKPDVSVELEEEESPGDTTHLDWPLFLSSAPKDFIQPFEEARTGWEALGRVRITKKRVFFELKIIDTWHKFIRCENGWIKPLARKDVDSIGELDAIAFERYTNRIRESSSIAKLLDANKLWLRWHDLSAADLKLLLNAAIELATDKQDQN